MTTKLRREMDNAMVLRGFALRTREAYLACVTALAQHYHRSPEGLDTVEIQGYLLHLIREKKLAYASVNQAVCAFRFLFDAVLGHKTLALEIPMAKVPKRLPQVLSREEVSRLFTVAASLRCRTVLMTTYAAGLRAAGGRHRERARPHVPEGAPRQGRPGSLHAALAPAAVVLHIPLQDDRGFRSKLTDDSGAT